MALPWIILLTPLFSAIFITLLTQRARNLSALLSIAACSISFLATCILFKSSAAAAAEYHWLNISPKFYINIGFTIDQLSRTMLLIVTGIGLLVHIYSYGYMEDDEGKSRYFAGLSLFMFSMLGIVLANNFVMMFSFWELVGVSSYILIGHWFDKPAPPAAAAKAFITNRVGDFGFMLGILMLWIGTGTVYFADLPRAIQSPWWPFGAPANIPLHSFPPLLTVATLLIFCGAIGKSAQFPLHVWLPDAMEGPTPVSALIHAATMVAAGVYMLSRVHFLVDASPVAQSVIAFIGITTAVGAALMATQQNDIKRILAYSTLSQLGYMVCAVGLPAYQAGMYHLFTHAFFKALLFLGSGAVIYGTHHEQDIWKMGGLKNRLPSTFITFLIGTLALTGCPGLAGFFSKDSIISAAYDLHHPLIFALALATAFLTSFYMFRLMIVVFWGHTRSKHAREGHQPPPVMTIPLMILAIPSVIAGYHWFAGRFLALPVEEHVNLVVMGLSIFVFIAGAGLAWVVYTGKDSDPILIPLFANRFYIDEIYKTLIALTQDLAASLSATFDRWILDGAIVRGVGGAAWVTGFVLRFLQLGNLQAYAFFFGAGSVAMIYYFVSRM
jgi:NADH-quinone oxidoreductase subunit L